LDSGFCVLLPIAALSTFGRFVNAQIKKRQYWPRFLPMDNEDGIEANLAEMDISDWGVHKVTFLGKPVFIVYIRDELYNSLFMAGFAPNKREGTVQIRCGGSKTFQNPAIKSRHLCARPFVDPNNQIRQCAGGQALEISWKMHRIIVRTWACYIPGTEANSFSF
jgi:hypothetical protein